MKSTTVFLVLFLFLTISIPANSQNVSEYRMKKIIMGEILQENTDVLRFFRFLNTREQDLLNSILQENYLLGYYAEVSQVSENAAFTERLSTTKERLRLLKEGDLYQIILHKAKNGTKAHLLRYVIRRHEAGVMHGSTIAASSRKPIDFFGEDKYWNGLFFGRVYANINNRHWTPLEPEEVFPPINPVKEDIKEESPVKPDSTASANKEMHINWINWSAIGKFSLISALTLLATAAVVVLIGACCCPHLPVFKQARALLEQ